MLADADDDDLDEGLLRDLFAYLEGEGSDQRYELQRFIGTEAEGGMRVQQDFGVLQDGPACQSTCVKQDQSQTNLGSGNRQKRQRDADKVKELEALAASKMEQFAALLQRNKELKFKSKILADAVMLRDFQLRIVREGKTTKTPWPMPSLPGSAAAGVESVAQADAVWMQPEFTGTTARAVFAPGSMQMLLSPECMQAGREINVRAIGRLELGALWKAFVCEASSLLLSLEANPVDETTACRLKHITADISGTCRRASLLAPDTMLVVLQTHLETDALAAPEPGFWLRVLQALKLTDEQEREMCAVYELFSGIMRRIFTERRTIQAHLSTALHTDKQTAVGLGGLQVPPEAEVLPALERNLRKEGAAHLLVRAFVFGKIFSIVQMSRAAVHSYPFFPNTTMLAAAAAGVSV